MATMTLKGKAKILAKATGLTLLIPFLFVGMLLLEIIQACVTDIIPGLVEATKREWAIIVFNVKKVFNSEGAK